MRILLGLCVVLLLGACNRVHTDHPLFAAGDTAGAPALRDGVWLIHNNLGVVVDDTACRFDPAKPVNRWPDCAAWMLVRGGEILGYDAGGEKAGDWTSIPYVLVKGEPAVLQIEVAEEGKSDFQYFGVEPTKSDAAGRVVAFRSWPVLCGPPPPPTPKGQEPRYVTLELLPGLTIDKNNCTAEAQAPVLAAAGASRAWDDGTSGAEWVRDSYP